MLSWQPILVRHLMVPLNLSSKTTLIWLLLMRLRNRSRLAAGYLYYGRQGKQTPQETQYIYDGEDTIFLKNSNISSSLNKKKVNNCILGFTHQMESIINVRHNLNCDKEANVNCDRITYFRCWEIQTSISIIRSNCWRVIRPLAAYFMFLRWISLTLKTAHWTNHNRSFLNCVKRVIESLGVSVLFARALLYLCVCFLLLGVFLQVIIFSYLPQYYPRKRPNKG